MYITSIGDCSDLYDSAAEKLKRLENEVDKTIQDLAKDVEARGVPKNKVARQVVKELTARGVLSPTRIYEGLGIENKRKYVKKVLEETFPQAENIPTEESSTTTHAVQVVATSTGHSESLTDMNRRISKELEEAYSERSMLKHEIADLKNQVKVLREKNTPELLKEIEEKFANDQKGVLDSKKMQKISMDAGKNLMILVERYNSILQEAVERGKPVPFGTYILTKPELKLVPIRIMVDFDRKRIWVELWEKRLQKLSR
jgi:NAD-dependent DNA ligase